MFGDPTIWVAVGLIIFIGIVIYAGAPKFIVTALDDRAKRIQTELDEARRLREEAQALLAEYQRKQRDAEKEAEDIVTQAREEAQRLAAETREKMAAAMERRMRLADDKISQAEAQAVKEVQSRAADIAVAAAERLLANELPDAKAKSLVNDGIKELGSKLN